MEFENKKGFEDYINSLQNCRIKIDIKRYRKPRSLDQNAMLHGMWSIMGRVIGMEVDEVKVAIKEKVGLYREIRGLRKYLSSADLDTTEAYILAEKTYQIAAEMDIVLPTPEEWKQMSPEDIDNLIRNSG